MDPVWLLILLPTAAISGWLVAIKDDKSKQNQETQIPDAFFKGLNLLLNEQPDKALDVFLQASELDENTVEMHIAMGNLYRRRGEIERATKIHQNLIARSDLDQSLKHLALFELAQDYLKAGLLDRSERLFQELRQVDGFKQQACQFLLQIYDQEKEWHSAIVIGEELSSFTTLSLSEPLSQYCCELAETAKQADKLGEAEYYLESAFRYDETCSRAGILSGEVAMLRGNYLTAINIFTKMQQWAPQALGEIVEMVAHCYKQNNDINGYRYFLEGSLSKNSDVRIISALIEIINLGKGKVAGYQKLIEIIKKHPSLDGVIHLLKNKKPQDISKMEGIDFEFLVNLIHESIVDEKGYSCRQCGFSSSSLHWQCPGCKDWGSVQKRNYFREKSSALTAVSQSPTVTSGL